MKKVTTCLVVLSIAILMVCIMIFVTPHFAETTKDVAEPVHRLMYIDFHENIQYIGVASGLKAYFGKEVSSKTYVVDELLQECAFESCSGQAITTVDQISKIAWDIVPVLPAASEESFDESDLMPYSACLITPNVWAISYLGETAYQRHVDLLLGRKDSTLYDGGSMVLLLSANDGHVICVSGSPGPFLTPVEISYEPEPEIEAVPDVNYCFYPFTYGANRRGGASFGEKIQLSEDTVSLLPEIIDTPEGALAYAKAAMPYIQNQVNASSITLMTLSRFSNGVWEALYEAMPDDPENQAVLFYELMF